MNDMRRPAGGGALVLVVGPSGAGKDTLIRLAGELLGDRPDVRFVRRIVTRLADAQHEDHDSIDEEDFARLVASSGAALSWRAHGLGYALPAEIDAWIGEGCVVVANVSRAIVGAASEKYGRLSVVHVTAPKDVLRERLLARGREQGADLQERLQEVPVEVPAGVPLFQIVNGGNVHDAAGELASAITAEAAPTR